MERDLAGKNKTHGSKEEQLKHARKYRDLLYHMQELKRQMKLLKTRGELGFPEANNNRSHGSKGEESKDAHDYYSLSKFLYDLTAIIEELGFDFDLDSIDYIEYDSDEETGDEEIEDEDLNLTVEKYCCDDDQLGRMKTNDAGESYLRMGDYVLVYVRDSKKEEIRGEEEAEDGCPICLGDHFNLECPWRDNVPPGQQVGRLYDIKCKGCGKWGLACCAEGGLAVLRRCGHCFDFGHWGDVCPDYKYMPLSAFPNYP